MRLLLLLSLCLPTFIYCQSPPFSFSVARSLVLDQFLAQGYKVGRVDQCETALGAELRVKDGKKGGPKAKGPAGKTIVRRELKSVLTSGTIVDGTLLTDDLASHCVAIKVSSLCAS